MVELIIEESGFPKDRETLSEMQKSWKAPIDEMLARLPGRRVLSGFVPTHGGGGAVSYTEGILLHDGKLWTVESYSGPLLGTGYISFFETVVEGEFNIGTQGSPIYAQRPWKIERTAKLGDHPDRYALVLTNTFIRGRKQLEYIKAGSIFVGNIVLQTVTAVYHIDFRENIGTKDYQVIGNFRAADPEVSFSRAFTWDINDRTNYGFDVLIQKATANSIDLIFDYTVVPINRVLPVFG